MFDSRYLLLFLIALAAVVGCARDDSEKIYLIKFPHVTAVSTPKGYGAERFRSLVAERLNGRVIVEVYPSSQLMNDDDSLEALAFGEIQMIAVSLSKFDRLTKKYQVFDLPFLFEDLTEVEAFQSSEAGKALLRDIDYKGFLGLSFWHNGMKQFSGPRPLRLPADAEGLKFRIMVSDVLEGQIMAMKANPQKMAFGEVYQALQTGAIDAQENTWSNMWVQKFYEVQPYITESNHGYLGYMVAVNTDFWEDLPDEIRLELEAIIAEVSLEVNAKARDFNQDARRKIELSGSSEIIDLEQDELAAWRRVMRPVWGSFAAEIGDDVMAATPAGSQSHD
jgi:C4-dicarboxylate-binding protein DctP